MPPEIEDEELANSANRPRTRWPDLLRWPGHHARNDRPAQLPGSNREARAELSPVRHETGQGTYVKPSKEAVNAYLDGYLKGATRGRQASTTGNYRDAFRPVRERLGKRPLQARARTGRTATK